MKVVVGLGNPGRKYLGTRHNVGFEVIAELSRRFGSPRPSAKFDSELVEIVIGGTKTVLQSPLTFMNRSGRAVRALTDFYKLSPSDILVVCDDFNLPVGRIRFRPSGSAGGQNGLHDVIRQLGTDQIARMRIGVGPPPEDWDVSDFVLSRFREQESTDINETIGRAAKAVETWIQSGTDQCMNQFNADPIRPDPIRPDPIRPDPIRPDPIRPDPIRPDPKKPDPKKPAPTQKPVKPNKPSIANQNNKPEDHPSSGNPTLPEPPR